MDDDGIRLGKKNQLKSVSFCEKQLAYINMRTICVYVCVREFRFGHASPDILIYMLSHNGYNI